MELLNYPFLQKALIVGSVLAFLYAVLGVFVVLRKMSFFADGVAHGSLAGVAVALLFSFYPLPTAIVFAIFFSLLIYFLERRFTFSADTVIGVLFTGGMAFGVVLINFTPGYQPDLLFFSFPGVVEFG